MAARVIVMRRAKPPDALFGTVFRRVYNPANTATVPPQATLKPEAF